MKKILFVCLGNICRSPMAEFIFKKMVKDKGLDAKYHIASAATSDEEAYDGGNPVYPPARRKLAENGISCDVKRAVQITKADYERYDLIIGMEQSNITGILRITGGDPENKVKLLMSYTDTPKDIADPWYSGNFDITYDEIYRGCKALLEHIESAN
ncbi:MAG: low molecular weight phosphotyrosine protein phosphatase [Eubacteriales bacterium]|nr:low molecular weight phosphotyrosine protein phosphatase [Eubacteriales bacterium]